MKLESARDLSPCIMRRGFWTFTALVVLAAILILSGTGECQTPTQSDSYLVGTIISEMFTGAVIKDAKGEQLFYRIHETLPDGSRIIKVADDHISLKGPDGALYTMFIMHGRTESREAGAVQASATASPPIGPPPEQATAPQNARRLGAGRNMSKRDADQTNAMASPPGASTPNQDTSPRKPRKHPLGRDASSEVD
jgi:hypothetical protein